MGLNHSTRPSLFAPALRFAMNRTGTHPRLTSRNAELKLNRRIGQEIGSNPSPRVVLALHALAGTAVAAPKPRAAVASLFIMSATRAWVRRVVGERPDR